MVWLWIEDAEQIGAVVYNPKSVIRPTFQSISLISGLFMPSQHLFRADWPHRWRRRSGLRRDGDVDKMPEEMLRWHEQT